MTVTFALASLAASASAAMALWSWTGSLTSLLQHGYSRLVISNYGDRVQAGRLRGAPDSRYGVLQYTQNKSFTRTLFTSSTSTCIQGKEALSGAPMSIPGPK